MINDFYTTAQSKCFTLLVSFLKIRQKLHLVIQVIEQHARRQWIIGNGLKRNLIVLTTLLEDDSFISEVCCHLDDISLHEFECFNTIVMLRLCVAPNSAVSAHHIGPMANGTKIETIIFACHYLGMTHSHSYPVR